MDALACSMATWPVIFLFVKGTTQLHIIGEAHMSLVIPDEVLQAARMSGDELTQEMAILLFQKDKLALGQTSRLAGMNQLQFQHLLASRQVSVHYDVAEFEEDLQTLQELKRLP
jgi:predicted HTH domain antitoxin